MKIVNKCKPALVRGDTLEIGSTFIHENRVWFIPGDGAGAGDPVEAVELGCIGDKKYVGGARLWHYNLMVTPCKCTLTIDS